MLVSDFDFNLPEELIAQEALVDRSSSRLLHLSRSTGNFEDRKFADFPVLLRPSDDPAPEITRLAEFTRYQSGLQGKATAYVCLNFRCRLPTTEVSQMMKFLNGGP